jgi:rhodanese-related sulfurtransferase
MSWLNKSAPPLLLDIRGHEVFMRGTIMGAVDTGLDPQGYLLGKARKSIVLITPDPADGASIRSWIQRLDIPENEVYLLQGGINAWQAAGFPVEIIEEGYVKPGTVPFVVPKGLCDMREPAQRFE